MILVLTVVVLAIIIGVIVTEGTDAYDATYTSMYAQEILNIQNSVDEYYYKYTKYPITGTTKTLKVSDVVSSAANQFQSETALNNVYTFYIIDLAVLGINDTKYGKNADENDVYVVSQESGKVYYLNGLEYKEKVYYTLNQDLYQLINVSQSSNITWKDVKKQEVIFSASEVEYTDKPVVIKVKVPVEAESISVTATNSKEVSEKVHEGAYNVITVNETGDSRNGNYDITVDYIYNGKTRQVTYSVTVFDNKSPTVDYERTSQNDIDTIKVIATDDYSNIKYIKYETKLVDDKEYFKHYGKTVVNNTYKIATGTLSTIYVEDNAGNSTILMLGWKYKADENGKYEYVTNGVQTLDIGDTIDYDETNGGKITNLTNVGWRVLGVTDSGNLKLISSDNVQELTLTGQEGYTTGINELNRISKEYGYGKGATLARSITVEDINRITGYNPNNEGVYDPEQTGSGNKYGQGKLWEYGNEVIYYWDGDEYPTYEYTENDGTLKTESLSYSHSKAFYYNDTYSPKPTSVNSRQLITTLKISYYYYTGSRYISTSSNTYKVVFKNEENSSNRNTYWCASSFIGTDINGAAFGMRYVSSGEVYRHNLFYSHGGAYSSAYGVCPVVVLDVDTKLSEVSNGVWNIK